MSKKSMKRTDKDDDINGSDLRFKPSKKRFLAAANTEEKGKEKKEATSSSSDSSDSSSISLNEMEKDEDVEGLVLKEGSQVRLPDKLFLYLSKKVASEVLYWQTGGEWFSIDAKKAQTELLDKCFNGIKFTSFKRSLNRWGFKRMFHAMLPKTAVTYKHPLFKRGKPGLLKEMKLTNTESPSISSRSGVKKPAALTPSPATVPTSVTLPPFAHASAQASAVPYSGTTKASTSSTSLPAESMSGWGPWLTNSMDPALLQSLTSSTQQSNETNSQHRMRQEQVLALQALLDKTQPSRAHLGGAIDIQSLSTLLAGQGPTEPQARQSLIQAPSSALPMGNDLQELVRVAKLQEQQKQVAQQLVFNLLTQHQLRETQELNTDHATVRQLALNLLAQHLPQSSPIGVREVRDPRYDQQQSGQGGTGSKTPKDI